VDPCTAKEKGGRHAFADGGKWISEGVEISVGHIEGTEGRQVASAPNYVRAEGGEGDWWRSRWDEGAS